MQENGMLLDFDTIPRKRTPNSALALPAHSARDDAELESPVFSAAVEQLRDAVVSIAAREPRTHLLHLDREAMQAEFEQSSKLFRFPDTITVAFEPVDATHATLSIYSRARFGYYDFGVNRKRVQRWLDLLADKLAGS
ncbi:hypothetical protein CKO28_08350 [Rhodovibrio sodomensis]|uniref:DUF1499 domain-containing protein n=2 Tax=Rhodovibrio sodomensis TaxID=1088 RepID=A0ABS1DDN9_9PROT|nr:hypothetical protein [Rhodovibrio sodomensis]